MGTREQKKDGYCEIAGSQPIAAFFGQCDGGSLDSPEHFHSCLEIGYCRKGMGEISIGKSTYPYEGETLAVIPPQYPHKLASYSKDSCWNYLFVDVDGFLTKYYRGEPAFAQRLLSRINKMAFLRKCQDSPVLTGLVFAIFREIAEKRELYLESVNGLLLALLMELIRVNGSRDMVEPEAESLQQIALALEYVEDNYRRQIKIRDLANACHLSETHFRRVFEEKTGRKPMDYINRVRVQKACELMGQKDSAMADIAKGAGFSTASTFNRNFKRIVGMSPYQWKTNERIGKQP